MYMKRVCYEKGVCCEVLQVFMCCEEADVAFSGLGEGGEERENLW